MVYDCIWWSMMGWLYGHHILGALTTDFTGIQWRLKRGFWVGYIRKLHLHRIRRIIIPKWADVATSYPLGVFPPPMTWRNDPRKLKHVNNNYFADGAGERERETNSRGISKDMDDCGQHILAWISLSGVDIIRHPSATHGWNMHFFCYVPNTQGELTGTSFGKSHEY